MSDIADLGSDREEEMRKDAVESARRKAGELEAEHTGFCLNCEAVVEIPRRWCNIDCRADWFKSRRK